MLAQLGLKVAARASSLLPLLGDIRLPIQELVSPRRKAGSANSTITLEANSASHKRMPTGAKPRKHSQLPAEPPYSPAGMTTAEFLSRVDVLMKKRGIVALSPEVSQKQMKANVTKARALRQFIEAKARG